MGTQREALFFGGGGGWFTYGRDLERREVGFCGGANDVVHGGVGKK